MVPVIIDQLLSEAELRCMGNEELEALTKILSPEGAKRLYSYYKSEEGDVDVRAKVKDAVDDIIYPLVLPSLMKERGIVEAVRSLSLNSLANNGYDDLIDLRAKLLVAVKVRQQILPTYPIRKRADFDVYRDLMCKCEARNPGKFYYTNQGLRLEHNRAYLIDRGQKAPSTGVEAIINRRVTVDMALQGIQYMLEMDALNVSPEERRRF